MKSNRNDGGAARRTSGAGAAIVAAAAVLLGGCNVIPPVQPDTTRYYVLTAETPKPEAAAPAAQPVRVALRPVTVPEFLNGRMLEVRVAANELRFIDQAHWAEPLDSGITEVLHQNLARNPALQLTARGEKHDYDVVVRFRACEGVVEAHAARIAAHIEIVSTGLDPKAVAEEDFATEIAGWDGQDYAQLAKKLSEAVARLSERAAAMVPGVKTG